MSKLPKGERRLKGKLTFSAFTSNNDAMPEGVTVELVDESSGVHFLELRIDMLTWGKLVAGRSYQSVDFLLRGLDLVGSTREHKREHVWIPRGLQSPYDARGYSDYSAAKPYVAEFEVDGWVATLGDCFNHHRIVSGQSRAMRSQTRDGVEGAFHDVGFDRYVDAK